MASGAEEFKAFEAAGWSRRANGSFDAVVGAFVLNHLPRPEVAAAELTRVLVGGGRLALSLWDVPERTRFLGLVEDAVARAGGHELPAVAKVGSGRWP